jgi:hypothetical protein
MKDVLIIIGITIILVIQAFILIDIAYLKNLNVLTIAGYAGQIIDQQTTKMLNKGTK